MNAMMFSEESPDGVCLSRRWVEWQEVGADLRLARKVRGEAALRPGALGSREGTADVLRAAVRHVIPVGFKRASVEVAWFPKGNRVEYALVDREVPRAGIAGTGN
jgi:hypothetical protein